MSGLPSSLHVFEVLLAAALCSMAVYALVARGPDADAHRKGTQFLLGLGNFLVHWFLWLISPAERWFLAHGATPDAFNFAGLALGAVSGTLIGAGHLELGGWGIVLGGICDIFDGRIARARQVSSPYGAFIDSTLDRFVEVFVFLGFVVYLRSFPLGPLAAAAAITGSLLVSYARARGESVGVLCKEGLMQRAERLVLTCLACLVDPGLSARFGLRPGTVIVGVLAVIATGTFWTAAQRTLWISQRLREGSKER